MGFIFQKAPGAAVSGDFTSFIQLGSDGLIGFGAKLTDFLTIGTVDAAVLPTATTIGDDVTKGLKVTVDSVVFFIPLLSTIS